MLFKKFILLFIFFSLFSIEKLQSQNPPELSATGNQAYCPLSEINIVETFTITNTEEVEIIYIQISEGYVNGQDILKLTGTHPNIKASTFNTLEGKIELEWIGTGIPIETELIAAVENVIYKSNSATAIGDRSFSITIGQANYLPSTDHYYEYVPQSGITWQQAKIAAESREYYTLQGYLATVTSTDEAQLTGEQAPGAGWIGGSDAAVEGTWRWVTGPENGKSFWIGGTNGTTIGTDIPYANWNVGEPNDFPDANIPGQENYAHVTFGVGRKGSWNDLPNGGSTGNYYPQGYLVEYGGMPGDLPLNISADTKIYIPSIESLVSPTPICGSGSTTLSATSTNGTILWFDSLTGGNKLGSGNKFTTPPISTTTTYYALASSDGICETGKREPITITVNEIPTITNTTNTVICGAGVGIITATASAGIINWYTTQTGGVSVGTGTTFTSPLISVNTTYYVDATENGCTTATRTPATITVQSTPPPTAISPQTFCDIENATLANLTVTGTTIQWYTTAMGGAPLSMSTLLVNNTTYYATQTINTCESSTRIPINVLVYETVVELPPAQIPVLQECDNASDGSDTNGFTIFNLTAENSVLLNGKNPADFTFSYFTDATYSIASKISNPTSFQNTIANEQTIYTRIANKKDNSCATELSFQIQVDPLPVITSTVTLKNCDEDGTPDGYTDFNLTEANPKITNGNSNLSVSYYLTVANANSGANPVNPLPFNNATAATVYARVENTFGCFRVATVTLAVSTTSFPSNYMAQLVTCDNDATIDGYATFDLTLASPEILNQFPSGQNLSVHYYLNANDAQLEENEILPQNVYVNITPYSQILYVRVESDDNGDCFGIGPHLTLTVNPRPEFNIVPKAVYCLNLPPITIEPLYANGVYTYEWFNSNGERISTEPEVTISNGGVYTAIATTNLGCESFPQIVTVSESENPTITLNDVLITDDSNNNTITINNQNNNLGIGDYEFALDDSFGPYQTSNVFENVPAGIHTIYVQDENGCGKASVEVSVIGYPNFFTPNGDGYNDYWQVLGVNSNFYPTSLIYIFDRFGKLITQVNPIGEGWNGTYNGQPLPASDYWFTVQLIDSEGIISEKRGHFSLVR
jgi:gliding motility-associated-like protein